MNKSPNLLNLLINLNTVSALGVRRGSLEGLFWFPPVLAETAHLENYGGRR